MSRFRLRNWRVWRRLVALTLLPTAVAGFLCFEAFQDAESQAERYRRAEALVRLSGAVAALTHELAAERGLSNGYASSGRHREDLFDLVKKQRVKVDTAAGLVRAAARGIGPSFAVRKEVDTVIGRVDSISLQRIGVTSRATPIEVFQGYSALISGLLSFLELIEGDTEISRGQRNLRALAEAVEGAGQQRGLLNGVLQRGTAISGEELAIVLVARQRQTGRVADFKLSATPAETRLYDRTVAGPEVDKAFKILGEVVDAASTAFTTGDHSKINTLVRTNAPDWFAVMTVVVDKIYTVEQQLVTQLITHTEARGEAAERDELELAGLLTGVMVMVLLLTSLVARSLVRPLRRLRQGALEVADTRLPGVVLRLRGGELLNEASVVPLGVDSTDEIGQVARAFDEVHREAVRLAVEESALRTNINAMFVNLSRRSQVLVESQLKLISDLESSEQDTERLGQLFRLDHLATRMRRNCENLLVLGGLEPARRPDRPVPLIDVVRAAVSEVEQYERVTLRLQPGIAIAGPVAGDLVHLISELAENALQFSPQTAAVELTAQAMSGGSVMIQIVDHGVGMSEDELRAANGRLRTTDEVDVAVARRMGLFVVGRLALRHGIRVELRPVEFGGVSVFVVLPGEAVAEVEPSPLISQPLPPRPAPPPPNGTVRGRILESRALPPPERSPIFEAVETEWFKRGASGRSTPPDPRWKAAERIAEAPAAAGRTRKGLPKRIPGQNRPPGALPRPDASGSAAGPARTADAVGHRLGGLQRGIRSGRETKETREI